MLSSKNHFMIILIPFFLPNFMDGAETQLANTLIFDPLITGHLYCQIHPKLVDCTNTIRLDDLLHLPINYFCNSYTEPCLEKIANKPFPKVYYSAEYM